MTEINLGCASKCPQSAFSSTASATLGALGYDHSWRARRGVRRSVYFTLHSACAESNRDPNCGRRWETDRAFPGNSLGEPAFVEMLAPGQMAVSVAFLLLLYRLQPRIIKGEDLGYLGGGRLEENSDQPLLTRISTLVAS
jgi:hypothetical protein